MEAPGKTDLSKCLLCQEITSEALRCPAKSKHKDVGVGQGYSTLSRNIMLFNELNGLPIPIDFRRLDEGNCIEATSWSMRLSGTNPVTQNSTVFGYIEQKRGNCL